MKRKWLVLAGLAVLLAGAVVINYSVNRSAQQEQEQETAAVMAAEKVQAQSPVETENYFAVFRQEREAVRNKELEYLEDIILSDRTDAETLSDAQRQKMNVAEMMEKEFSMESQIRAKGFADAAVTFHQNAVNVVLRAPELTPEKTAQVLDIVLRETKVSANNVKISTLQE